MNYKLSRCLRTIASTALSLMVVASAPNLQFDAAAKLPDDVESSFRVYKARDLNGRILFTAEIAESQHIFTADLEKLTVARVISDEYSNHSAKLSPNGKQIVFISNRVQPPQLFMADWTGDNMKQLTFSKTSKSYPSWSADGKTVYFAADSGKGEQRKSNIYLVRLEDLKEIKVTSLGQRNTAPSPHPKLDVVAYTTNRFWPGWDVCVWDGLSQKEACVMSGDASFVKPRFSTDGSLLALVRSKGQLSELGIYSYLDGSKKTRFYSSSGRQGDFSWVKNKQIVFSERDRANDPFKVKLLDIETRNVKQIISSKYSMKGVSWSPVTLGSLEEMQIAKEFKVLKFRNKTEKPEDYAPPYLRKSDS